jgi:hypothetical protein
LPGLDPAQRVITVDAAGNSRSHARDCTSGRIRRP